jgi:aldose 1-epimerase
MSNRSNLMSIKQVLPHGLTFHRLFVQVDGRVRTRYIVKSVNVLKALEQTHDILVGPEDPKGHLEKKYTNTVIGRYTNRVPVGTFEVEKNGVKASLTTNANGS